VLLAVAAVGCASRFDPASKLKTLRVLAVQKDKPYARPGDTVHLKMLVTDPRSRPLLDGGAKAGMRELSVGRLSGCENPDGDSYQQCVPKLVVNHNYIDGTLDFALTLSPDIISSRPPPANPAQARFGSSFVFFAACAGKLVAFGSPDSPFGCRSNTNAPLGPNDFVVGYSEVFAYERLTNHNPIVGLDGATSFEVDGNPVQPDCVGDDCVALTQSELALRPPTMGDPPPPGIAPAVPPPPSCDSDDPRCFEACTTDDEDKCPKHTINLVVDKASAELDGAATATEGRDVLEQMWVNYYADGGKLEHEVKLLNDATTGWNPNHSSDLRVPKDVGPFRVWAVAHDNRGGSQWVGVTLATRAAGGGR
jgi:hypothetical protein